MIFSLEHEVRLQGNRSAMKEIWPLAQTCAWLQTENNGFLKLKMKFDQTSESHAVEAYPQKVEEET